VYFLQTVSPASFHVVEDSWQDFLGFSVNIFASKICFVSASLVQCEDYIWFIPKILATKAVLSSLVTFLA
jgi:hypothetical protein